MSPGSTAAAASPDAIHLTRFEQLQIDYCRIICRFFMMTVHIYPFVSHTSYLYLGPWHGFWLVGVDYLGRASVAALSFVSGYILFVNGRQRPLSRIAADRSRSLLIPLLSWNTIK